MTFNDILKKSFLEAFSTTALGTREILIVLSVTTALSLYIYLCYRFLIQRVFYSKFFCISLVSVAIITAAIILAIQSSVVISLGMVGALSIVRFRTAIKDPVDLTFLFWSISVGIICGARLIEVAVILSLALTVIIFTMDKVPMTKTPMLLVINADDSDVIEPLLKNILRRYVRKWEVRSQNISGGQLNLVIELRVKNGGELVNTLSKETGIRSVSLLKHDGEVAF